MAYTAVLLGGCSRPRILAPTHREPSSPFRLRIDGMHLTSNCHIIPARTLRVRSYQHDDSGSQHVKASISGSVPSTGGDEISNDTFDGWRAKRTKGKIGWKPNNSLLIILASGCVLALMLTIAVACSKRSSWSASSFGLPYLVDGSLTTSPEAPLEGFKLQVFRYRLILPEYTPGWVYFCLLMAAGCGLFISEEALNIWVGISIARRLTLHGTWESFSASFLNNASHIISTVFWVYWGVCISDMIPFYIGQLVSKTKASEEVWSKVGISKRKADRTIRLVKRYGNLIGFVERFSLGVRNPTSFLAGAMGISPARFFVGVCCGGLVTLPVQLAIGFLLRDRPVFAVASVATIVGIWTLFPYVLAALTTLFLYIRHRSSQ